MSERVYLISKAERDLDEVFKAKNERPGAMHSLAGNFLGGPIGAAVGSAVGAPKGRKARAAAGSGLGATGGLAGGVAGQMAIMRKVKNPYVRTAGGILPVAGMFTGGAAGHHVGVGRGPYKQKG